MELDVCLAVLQDHGGLLEMSLDPELDLNIQKTRAALFYLQM